MLPGVSWAGALGTRHHGPRRQESGRDGHHGEGREYDAAISASIGSPSTWSRGMLNGLAELGLFYLGTAAAGCP